MTLTHRLLAGVAAAGLLAATPAFAQTTDHGTFDAMDVNQDGYIDETEWRDGTGLEGGFVDYDRDADGRLSREEWGAFEEGQMIDQGADVSNEPADGAGSANAGSDETGSDGTGSDGTD